MAEENRSREGIFNSTLNFFFKVIMTSPTYEGQSYNIDINLVNSNLKGLSQQKALQIFEKLRKKEDSKTRACRYHSRVLDSTRPTTVSIGRNTSLRLGSMDCFSFLP
jgi:hypothetical protein